MVKTPVAAPRDATAAPPMAPLPIERWVITVCGAAFDYVPLRAAVEAEITSLDMGVIEKWRQLGPKAHELTCSLHASDEEHLRRQLTALGDTGDTDIVLQVERHVRGGKALAVFDLDSTLIAEETIDELAKEMGVSDKVQALTRLAMAGDLGFREALFERVATLNGLPTEALERVKMRATCTPGALETVRALKRLGCTTAVVSGGFKFLANHIKTQLGLDYAFSNTLELTEDGKHLTGRTIGPIVDAEFKANTLSNLARELHIPSERIMAVGDGSNDVIMLQRAGLGVAFNAKPKVQNASKARVNQPSLVNCLYLLGLDDEDIQTLTVAKDATNES